MTAPRTVVDLKKTFLTKEIRLLNESLQPTADWQERLPEHEDGDIRDSVVEEVLQKLNAISRHHNKASYSSQALRQVAEQIDALYWASSDSSIDVGGDEVLEKGVDLRRADNIARLPEQWLEDEGYGDEGLEIYAELLSRLMDLASQRQAQRTKIQQYRHLQRLLEPLKNPQETVQPNLVTKDGDLAKELDKMRFLMARVSGRVAVLDQAGGESGRQSAELESTEEKEKLLKILDMR